MARATKESTQEIVRGINDQLNSLFTELSMAAPITTSSQRTQFESDFSRVHRELVLEYTRNPPARLPSPENLRLYLLGEIESSAENADLKAAAERLLNPEPVSRAPQPRSQEPAASAEREMEPMLISAVTPTTTPRRTSAPTISELRSQGYTNVIDVRFDEENKVYRFACNDPNLDLIGMTRQQLIDYAKENPSALKIFEVNARGYATKEVRPSSLE